MRLTRFLDLIRRLNEGFSPEWIDQIYADAIRTGMMSPDGTPLEEFIQTYEQDDQWWEGSDPRLLRSPRWRTGFRDWLTHRYVYVLNQFRAELRGAGGWPLRVVRAMRLTPAQLLGFRSGAPLGVYWAVDGPGYDVQPYSATSDAPTYQVRARVRPADVNWLETLRSRMDYVNGDRESEIQLLPGRTLRVDRITDQTGTRVQKGFVGVS